MAPLVHRRSLAFSYTALAVGVLGTLYCIYVIYQTAQIPEGDGTGMQWIVLTPLSALFFCILLPALVMGVNGLRAHRALSSMPASQARDQTEAASSGGAPERIQKQEFGFFKTVAIVLIALVLMIYIVAPFALTVLDYFE